MVPNAFLFPKLLAILAYMTPKLRRFLRLLPQIFFVLVILQIFPLSVYGATDLDIAQIFAVPNFYRDSDVILEGYVQWIRTSGELEEHWWGVTAVGDVVTLVDPTGTIEVYAPRQIDPAGRIGPYAPYPLKQGMYVRLKGKVTVYGGRISIVPLHRERRIYYPLDVHEVEPPCLPSGGIQNQEFRNFNRCRQRE